LPSTVRTTTTGCRRVPAASHRDEPHAKPPLPCDFPVQATMLHPARVALTRRTTGAGQGFGHRGRDKWPLSEGAAQDWRCFPRERGQHGFGARRASLDILQVSHRGQASVLHSDEPAKQSLGRRAAVTQAPCPAHGQRREDCPLSLACRDSRRGDGHFHPAQFRVDINRSCPPAAAAADHPVPEGAGDTSWTEPK